ncbi:hypothetical protein HYQ45_011921 [Verticillium longisporum]|uniref:Uncharacterized protein n=3 Tax=Verticillium TaxID=1036719 RepID=A0A8I3AN96_VERLO|nr:hypothetical protein HYQ45_011921 [Verticillium longisporum]
MIDSGQRGRTTVIREKQRGKNQAGAAGPPLPRILRRPPPSTTPPSHHNRTIFPPSPLTIPTTSPTEKLISVVANYTWLRKSNRDLSTFLSRTLSLQSAKMAREGTRSQTGHSKPRIFETVDTAPVTQRKKTTTKPAVKKAPVAPAVKGAKPTGVTKKKTAPKKDGPVAKAKTGVNKAEKKVEEVVKPKKATTTKTAKPKTVAK